MRSVETMASTLDSLDLEQLKPDAGAAGFPKAEAQVKVAAAPVAEGNGRRMRLR